MVNWHRILNGTRGILALLIFASLESADAQTGTISTVAGDGFRSEKGEGRFNGDGASASSASLNFPSSVFKDASGNLYIADLWNRRIRKVDESGIISTVAGNGLSGFSGDGGPATLASLSVPSDVFIDRSGNLYIVEPTLDRIRRVDESGIISTVAGNGLSGFSGDGGPATLASLSSPGAIFVDGSGNLYIADSGNNRIRKVGASSGIIITVAGSGEADFSGDGGPATRASLFYPTGVFLDRIGNMYISDGDNHRVRKVDASTGIINTVAGDGEHGFSGDGGPATRAQIGFVSGVFVDDAGNLFIAATTNHRIRKVDVTGKITTVAGDGFKAETGYGRFSGDGDLATRASLSYPRQVFVDKSGDLYIPDEDNHRIRLVLRIATPTFLGGAVAASDFHRDGIVDFSDYLEFMVKFGETNEDPGFEGRFDLNDDGIINFQDFLLFAAAFGE